MRWGIMAQSFPTQMPAILVVEDDGLVRMSLAATIEDEGFTVYEAAHAEAAIRIMEAHPEIRVLFTDIHMPGSMDGIKLSHYVRNRWPPVKIFVASGRSRPSIQDMPPGSVFISKPYQGSDLRQVYEAALSR
jgi:two-component system, response regulator PdtaR